MLTYGERVLESVVDAVDNFRRSRACRSAVVHVSPADYAELERYVAAPTSDAWLQSDGRVYAAMAHADQNVTEGASAVCAAPGRCCTIGAQAVAVVKDGAVAPSPSLESY